MGRNYLSTLSTPCSTLKTPVWSSRNNTVLARPVRVRTKRSLHSRNLTVMRAQKKSFIDYYDVLSVGPGADEAEIKVAYRQLQKRCHPDVAGDLGHDMSSLLNEAYTALQDPQSRYLYDMRWNMMRETNGFTGQPLSAWAGPLGEERGVFVDEGACIGCLKCALQARHTFAIHQQHGKARVTTQWGDDEERLTAAVETCPVDCIHWVPAGQLPFLEHVMQKQLRFAGVGRAQGRGSDVDPFQAAAAFAKRWQELQAELDCAPTDEMPAQRHTRAAAAAGIRAQKAKGGHSGTGMWGYGMWQWQPRPRPPRHQTANNISDVGPSRPLSQRLLPQTASASMITPSARSASAPAAAATASATVAAPAPAGTGSRSGLGSYGAAARGPTVASPDRYTTLAEEDVDDEAEFWQPPLIVPQRSPQDREAAGTAGEGRAQRAPRAAPHRAPLQERRPGPLAFALCAVAAYTVVAGVWQSGGAHPLPALPTADGAVDAQHVEAMKEHKAQADECFAKGGGICRFLL